jgi:hypothetical protein
MQVLGLRLGGGRSHRSGRLAGRTMTPRQTLLTPLSSGPVRPEPVLCFTNEAKAPAGAFAELAIPNAVLRVEDVPRRGARWGAIEAFALSYDGAAYWSDIAEVGTRAMQGWTRDRSLPHTLHELRGCLFFEQRRWHHFGEEPHGRGAEYIWALLDAIRSTVTLRPPLQAVPAAVTAPPAAVAPPSLPAPPLPPPPTPVAPRRRASRPAVAVFADDDAGYLAWASDHREGYVVHVPNAAGGRGLRLHRASCPSVVGDPAKGRSFTATARKAGAADEAALLAWCVETLGRDPEPCQRCKP